MSSLHLPPLQKLRVGDKVAILSPSFAAPAQWPYVYEVGLQRLRDRFGLEPVEYPCTKKRGASKEERTQDLIAAFEDPEIKGVIATLGGDDQIVYARHLPDLPFRSNPKPFFGYSDNTHFAHHLWLNGVRSFYGGALFCQFAQSPDIDTFTEHYLRAALFGSGYVSLTASETFNEVSVDWGDPEVFRKPKPWEPNAGWIWDGNESAKGITWGGCVESIDEILRHGVKLPSLEQFEQIVLLAETSEEAPSAHYVNRVFRGLGELGILKRVQAVLVGRPMSWSFEGNESIEHRSAYRKRQAETILKRVRAYNSTIPVVQNLDFGHTKPQIPIPYGAPAEIDSGRQTIAIEF